MNVKTRRRICVVADDDAQIRVFVSKVLSRDKFRVLVAQDGEEVLALLNQQVCDVLVTDLAMPHREGIETIIAVRQRFPWVKILAISGVFGENMLEAAEHFGASASLPKPFTADALVAAVEALVRRLPA